MDIGVLDARKGTVLDNCIVRCPRLRRGRSVAYAPMRGVRRRELTGNETIELSRTVPFLSSLPQNNATIEDRPLLRCPPFYAVP